MSDKDASHTLAELQEARGQVDQGRRLLSKCLPYVWREYFRCSGVSSDDKYLIDQVTLFLQTGDL